jgi:benzoate-CoA ligase family protein
MIDIPENINLAEYYLDRNVTLGRGDKVAVYYKDRTYTYAELVAYSNRVGNFLKSLGVEIEDRVMMIVNDSPEFVASWYGIIKIGAVATDVYSFLRPKDYEYFFNYTRAKVAIVDALALPNIEPIINKAKYLKHLVVIGQPDSAHAHLSFESLVESSSGELEVEETCADDVALWKFTSGSTGKPKGVQLTHRNSIYNFQTYGLQVLGLQSDDIVIAVPKLFFGYARDIAMVYCFGSGASVVLFSERTTAERIFDYVEKYRCTVLVNVPTMINAMINLPGAAERDLSSLRFCTSAGEALPEELYHRWKKMLGVEVLNCIGSCELYHMYISNRLGRVKPGSLGEMVPGYSAKICNAEGEIVPDGEEGVLWVQADSQGLGYWQAHAKSRQTFQGMWVNTGDLFRKDSEGYYWFVGRSGELLKVGGIFVAPLEIENCLLSHPAVGEVAVIGAPDAQGLIKPKAFIAVKAGHAASPELATELQRYVKEKLSPYKYPRTIEFMGKLPKNSNDKIDIKALKEIGMRHDRAAV